MRKIIAIAYISLDGVMQAPGGPEEDRDNGFPYGGWSMGLEDEQFERVISETLGADYDLLLGRRTYDIWAPYWPLHNDNEIGRKFNAARKYVATNTLSTLDWENSQPVSGDVVEKLRSIKAEPGPEEIHVWGSTVLLQTLTAAGLVDEYRLWTYPIVIGQGKRMFKDGLPLTKLRLAESQAMPCGVVVSRYVPAEQGARSAE